MDSEEGTPTGLPGHSPTPPADGDDTAPGDDDGTVGADRDEDGYPVPADCDDGDGDVHPGAEEICNGRDDDCDGSIDEDVAPTWYRDEDGDGHGVPGSTTTACQVPDGYAASGDDCDDEDSAVHPDAREVCDGKDNDCDGVVDEADACSSACPPDMVAVSEALCVDRYEASRPDATAVDAGSDESRATSRAGVLPWMVNPMDTSRLEAFRAACAAAGKRLCTAGEWESACVGPGPGTYYVYGDTFDPEACNCVDSFCDDYCLDQGIPLESCDTGPNCGYDYYCFHVAPSGSFEACTNYFGTFDMNGNVWEVVVSGTDPRGYELRGGAFNCASASSRVNCSYNAGWDSLYAGFRCCLDTGGEGRGATSRRPAGSDG